MKNAKLTPLFSILLIALVVACGGSYEEDASATDSMKQAAEAVTDAAEEIVEDAAEMVPEDIQAQIDEYKTLLVEKEAKLKELADRLKEMSPTDLAGDQAKSLQSESETLTSEIASIKEKLQAYME